MLRLGINFNQTNWYLMAIPEIQANKIQVRDPSEPHVQAVMRSVQPPLPAGDSSSSLAKKETCFQSLLKGLRSFFSFLARLFCCCRSERAKASETATKPHEMSEKEKVIDEMLASWDGNREALKSHLLIQDESFILEIAKSPCLPKVLDKLSGRSKPPRIINDEPIDLKKGKAHAIEEILKRWKRVGQWQVKQYLQNQDEAYVFNIASNPATIQKVLDELGGFNPLYFS